MKEETKKQDKPLEVTTITFALTPKQLEAYHSLPPFAKSVNGKNQMLSIDEAAKEIFVQFIIQTKARVMAKELTT